MKLNEVLSEIDSWSCTALLILFYVFMVTGYMITRGFLDRYWGIILHTTLDLPIMAVFSIHFASRARFFLLRRRLAHGPLLNLVTLLLGFVPLAFIVYLDLFFQLR